MFDGQNPQVSVNFGCERSLPMLRHGQPWRRWAPITAAALLWRGAGEHVEIRGILWGYE